MKKNKHGGNRKGAGRKQKYGEPTKVVSYNVPESKVDEFKTNCKKMLKEWEVS